MKYIALLLVLGAAELNSMQEEKRAITKKIIIDDYVSAASQANSIKCLKCPCTFASTASLNMHQENLHPASAIKREVNSAHSVVGTRPSLFYFLLAPRK